MNLALTINGQARRVAAGLTDTLLTVLRDQLLLTAAKRGCNQGVCGACTVLIDGRPVRSCLTLAADCQQAKVTTLEGLKRDPAMARLQASFASGGAVQCGFCTPGMLIAAHWLLGGKPNATAAEIRAGLSGNLCRCTGYAKIMESVEAAAASAKVAEAAR